MLREAEVAKARIHVTSGKDFIDLYHQKNSTMLLDEKYVVVGAHIEDQLVQKIIKRKYVDFGKLIPKDRVLLEEDSRMEMHVKNGKTYWIPVHETSSINNFNKWEQAFRVFANIYTKANPNRAAELIEYNRLIHTASLSFAWDNVYLYDKEFRLHMSRYPQRSWAIILQQAWSMCLKDRIHRADFAGGSGFNGNSSGGSSSRARINEPCRRFNRGKCNFGLGCRYEHRCSYCYKFGHSTLNCRKAQANRSSKGRGSSSQSPVRRREHLRDNHNHENKTK